MDPKFGTGSEVRTFGLRLTSLVKYKILSIKQLKFNLSHDSDLILLKLGFETTKINLDTVKKAAVSQHSSVPKQIKILECSKANDNFILDNDAPTLRLDVDLFS